MNAEIDSTDLESLNADAFWQRVRRDFPVTKSHAYLNSAGAGPVPNISLDAAMQFYRETLESGDGHWDDWLIRRETARAQIAQLINAEPYEIGFTTNTSNGMNLIIDALENRGESISCELEFPVTTIPWLHRGAKVNFIKSINGEVTPEMVAHTMTDRTGIICLSHVQYSNGFRADIETIGNNKGRHLLVINAAQSAGVLPIDVKRMKIDALCSTGHKWMLGGYGSGFVYISREILHETRARAISWLSVKDPFAMRNREVVLKTDAAARSEIGCPHFAGIFALGTSAEYIRNIGRERIERRALELNRHLTNRLTEASWKVLSPLHNETARSAETLIAATDGEALAQYLNTRNIAVTQKPEGIRAATHFFNDESDIARLIDALDDARNHRI